jgi:hypothetical protein
MQNLNVVAAPGQLKRSAASSFPYMAKLYEVEKWIWTEADFEQMGWHDVQVYAVSFIPNTFELMLDIDYIFEWIHPAENDTCFKFWISPATLVFENVYGIEMALDEPYFELDAIERTEPRRPTNAEYIERDTEWQWNLEAHRGGMSFRSIGYKQYIRKKPVLSQLQTLEMGLRGGISFHRERLDM